MLHETSGESCLRWKLIWGTESYVLSSFQSVKWVSCLFHLQINITGSFIFLYEIRWPFPQKVILDSKLTILDISQKEIHNINEKNLHKLLDINWKKVIYVMGVIIMPFFMCLFLSQLKTTLVSLFWVFALSHSKRKLYG